MKIIKPILISLITIGIIFRLLLPHYLLRYVENEINKIPDYHVKIADLDVHLYRGAYTIKNIQLWKITNNIPVPFYQANTMDFSIDWPSLVHGKIVAKIIVQAPKINFVTAASEKNEQLIISRDWIDIVKKLYPLNINLLAAHHGEVALISYKGKPPFKLYLKNIEFEINNMQKATDKKKLLPSQFYLTGDAIGGGTVSLEGDYDPFNKQPTFSLKTKLTSLRVVDIAPFLKHYTNVDVTGGTFSLYSEVVAAKGKIEGYIKPFIKNISIGSPKNSNPIEAIVDGAASIVANIVKNSKQQTVATKIIIRGDVDDPDTSIWSILGYVLKHGFIQALIPSIDHSVRMQDVLIGKSQQTNQSKSMPRYRP